MNFSKRRFLGAAVACTAASFTPLRAATAAAWSDCPSLLARALAALDARASSIPHRDFIGIVDFSAHSRLPRFYILDTGNGRLATTHLVAHGRGSDPYNSGLVEHFSNRPGSNASCEGAFVTSDIYHGKHGRSRRLLGLDSDNNLASSRGIVIHAASYVDDSMATAQGRIGRSQGCFAVSDADIALVLDRLGPGRLLFAGK